MPEASNSAKLSIIMPVLDVAARLEASLQSLQPLRDRGHELLIVDGGSRDGTVTLARKYADRVLLSGTGRSLQMNTGTEYATNDILLFLPVDSRLPPQADDMIVQALQSARYQWGHFALRIGKATLAQRVFAQVVNWRTGATGTAITEQAIFVTRQLFERVKGFDSMPEGEDMAFTRKLSQFAKPLRLKSPVLSFSTKWQHQKGG
ncbi:MAG: glycosyltransferase family 2 protein [Pseudomonadota bacterium]